MNILRKSLRGPYGLIGAPGFDEIPGMKKLGRATSDPLNLFPKRPVIEERVSGSGMGSDRRAQGRSHALMGVSRLTGQ